MMTLNRAKPGVASNSSAVIGVECASPSPVALCRSIMGRFHERNSVRAKLSRSISSEDMAIPQKQQDRFTSQASLNRSLAAGIVREINPNLHDLLDCIESADRELD
jgi:hypothetical protein